MYALRTHIRKSHLIKISTLFGFSNSLFDCFLILDILNIPRKDMMHQLIET